MLLTTLLLTTLTLSPQFSDRCLVKTDLQANDTVREQLCFYLDNTTGINLQVTYDNRFPGNPLTTLIDAIDSGKLLIDEWANPWIPSDHLQPSDRDWET